ncbi:hypothetical protein ACS0TY_017353 [Phlomoides rotata]
MESHYFEYGLAGAGYSYTSYPNASSMPSKMFGSLEFNSRNSTNQSFPTHYDAETLFRYNDSLDQNSRTDNPSEATPSSNSSLDYNSYFNQSEASPFSLQDSSPITSTPPSFLNSVDDDEHIRHALQELESALMAADSEEEVFTSEPPHDSWFYSSDNIKKLHRIAPGGPPPSLRQLLIACAESLFENRLIEYEMLVEQVRAAVSISGEPIQRLGAYMLEGLTARKESSGNNIYRALKGSEPDSKDIQAYMHILYSTYPYWKFGYLAANGAIAEACKNEDHIHIIDFQIAQGKQWMTLLQALASRPGGAPHVRITGIEDPTSKYLRGEGLAAVGERFESISKKFNISVEFNAVLVYPPDITREMLDIRTGEALAVNFPLQLHHAPDESVDESNPRDGLLRMVKSLSPKVVTLMEQESNTNTAAFLPRFVETLDFYTAMFESIDVCTPRESKDRINMEQHCLARDIVNVIACEGRDRVERHELLGKWKSRFMMAGFRQLPLSSYVNSVIKGLLKCYSENYTLREVDGATMLGWKDRNLISASAWH